MRKICLLFLCIVPASLQAQVTVSVQLPPGGLIQKDQLWNVAVMNASNVGFDVCLLLSLQDVSTGQTVLTASTRNITLSPGIKTLRVQDLLPVQYNYSASEMEGTYIPLGTYNACYTVSRFTTETQTPVATECVRISINPLSPPLLNFPADKSIVTVPYPQFTWTPPAPLNMFNDLSYDLNIVELLEGQSAMEAISNNTPVYSRNILHVPYESYAASYSPLEKNKTYAWQVTARNGFKYASATDVWTFTLGDDSVTNELADRSYIEMRTNQPSGVAYPLPSNNLQLKYYSYGNAFQGVFRFYNNNKLIKEVRRDIVYGDNYLSIPLDKSFEKDKLYRVELTDQQKKTASVNFIIQQAL